MTEDRTYSSTVYHVCNADQLSAEVVAQPDLFLTFESTGLSQDAADYFSSTFVLFAPEPDAPTPQNTSLANFVHWVQPSPT